jgi:sulfide:quinone oxidoreductase
MARSRVVVLGAGFGGLELTTMLSEAFGEHLDLTLIDRNDSFFFGFSKLDVMFGRSSPESVRLPYGKILRPGVHFRQETITAIDPHKRRVTTNRAIYDADVLVVALGADYDVAATPGLAEAGHEFYSLSGATALRDLLPKFTRGRAVIGAASAPFKCPPAPSETALLLHDFLMKRGVRTACEISLVLPFAVPIPPSPATSKALLAAFAERGITFVPGREVRSLDPAKRVAVLDDGAEMPFDLFLGVPVHRVPKVVEESGMTEDGWIPVDPPTLATKFPRVYAVGDVTEIPVAKAGVFAESAARVVAQSLIAEFKGGEKPPAYTGAGSCYVEFGGERVGRVDVDFMSGPKPTGTFEGPSQALAREKERFGASRRARWFGLSS